MPQDTEYDDIVGASRIIKNEHEKSLELTFDDLGVSAVIKIKRPGQRKPRFHAYKFLYLFADGIDWNIFGRALGSSNTLRKMKIIWDMDITSDEDSDDDLIDNDSIGGEIRLHNMVPGAIQSMQEIYNGLKYNRSIESLSVQFFPSDRCPILDLVHLLQNNQRLKMLKVACSDGPWRLLHNQSLMIANCLEDRELYFLDMGNVRFNDVDFSLERIVSACVKVKKLRMTCHRNFEYDFLATLLQDPESMLASLDLTDSRIDGDIVSKIVTSLGDNDNLKELKGDGFLPHIDLFGTLLCDPSSIDSIVNSNHTLHSLGEINDWFNFYQGHDIASVIREHCTDPESQFTMQCLHLNKLDNKGEVIRKKIGRFYFNEDFDDAPFLSMPISLLPQVLGLIECFEAGKQRNAHFRLLRCIPELCDVSERNNMGLSSGRIKRQRTGKLS